MSDTPMCHICRQISRRSARGFVLLNPGKLEHCLLCNRLFCAKHKAVENNTICKIRHDSYYDNHWQLHGTGTIFRSMTHRNIEMDPSNAGFDRITKVLMEREEDKKIVEEEKRRIEEAAKSEGTSEEIAKHE
ncbi:uncharacterized protein Bfra_003292 [Botrytis fragariae]|uniref:Uncharacterized protein n=1 Tax=Botrytis fragariae TaxID=1964551 RepID=A0A8H6AWG6_9HELO|nr:uncharacterized protein Bfra_003292 [Botrytis fragariae]KAF5874843.1 hypothetical protein Bfra_003292 [Botrytis fragariae]